jgi:hypothetical protein
MDEPVEQRLKNNPKVRVKGDQYAYQVSERWRGHSWLRY